MRYAVFCDDCLVQVLDHADSDAMARVAEGGLQWRK